MLNARHALVAATLLGGVLLPATVASASTDQAGAVGGLANDAAEVVAEEQELLNLNAPQNPMSAADRAEARSRLRTVDARGNEILHQMDAIGVELTDAIRTTLNRLPQPSVDGLAGAPKPPPAIVYEAAIADLMRIAATPAAVTPVGESSGVSNSLLMVAVAAVLVLMAAAISSALRRKDETLEAMAWSDGLTGVANRRKLDHDLAAHSQVAGSRSAVIMIDVDHFKMINDRFGHKVGDEVLCKISTTVASQVRQGDVVYRYGGEEFCVLLPGATEVDAEQVANRIVSGVRSIALPDGQHVTVSIGVADGAPRDVVGTLESADRALYTAKAGGRDRTHAGSESLQPA